MSSDYVRVEVFDDQKKKAVLNVSGPITMSYIKKGQISKGVSKDELYDLLLRKIGFEELEGALEKEPEDYFLKTMMNYLDDIEESDDPVLSGLFKIQRNVKRFKEDLKQVDEVVLVQIHQIHKGDSEENDFMDYLNIPMEEEEEVMRTYLEENLSSESEIDAIMDRFEDGEFYINTYEADQLLCFDLLNNITEEKVIVSEVY